MESVRDLVTHALSNTRHADLRRAIRNIQRPTHAIQIHVLHQCARYDDLRTLELVFGQVYRCNPPSRVLDAPLGRHSYTPLCIAAYNGSPRVTKYLISQGADVHYRNSHGEDLHENLDAGEADAVTRSPQDAIFIRERYRACRNFIRVRQDYLAREAVRPPVDYTPRKPRRIVAAGRIWAWWKRVRPLTSSR